MNHEPMTFRLCFPFFPFLFFSSFLSYTQSFEELIHVRQEIGILWLVSCSPLRFPANVFVPPSRSSNLLKVVDFFGYTMYGTFQVSKISNQVHKIPFIVFES